MVNCNSLTKRNKIASYFSTCNINTPPNDTVKPPSLELYCEVKPQRTHIKLAYRCKRQKRKWKILPRRLVIHFIHSFDFTLHLFRCFFLCLYEWQEKMCVTTVFVCFIVSHTCMYFRVWWWKMKKHRDVKRERNYATTPSLPSLSSSPVLLHPTRTTCCEFRGSMMNYMFNCLCLVLRIQCGDWFLSSKLVIQRTVPGWVLVCAAVHKKCPSWLLPLFLLL